ncbi:radical SAM protein [Catellatospora coxensis]
MIRDVDVLWALRSPCNLGCRYCYFGTLLEHREQPVVQIGQLSHLSRADLGFADLAAFADTLAQSPVRRVFLAGGEPLIWPPVFDLIERIKRAGVEVVVCTNGVPSTVRRRCSGCSNSTSTRCRCHWTRPNRVTTTGGGRRITARTAGTG